MLGCIETWVAVVIEFTTRGWNLLGPPTPRIWGLGVLPELGLNFFHPAGWRGRLLSGSEKWVAMTGSPGRGDEICRVRTAKPAVLHHTHPHPHGRLKNQFLLVALDVWEWNCFQVARTKGYHCILFQSLAKDTVHLCSWGWGERIQHLSPQRGKILKP